MTISARTAMSASPTATARIRARLADRSRACIAGYGIRLRKMWNPSDWLSLVVSPRTVQICARTAGDRPGRKAVHSRGDDGSPFGERAGLERQDRRAEL